MIIFIWIIVIVFCLFAFVVFFGAPYVPSLQAQVRHAFNDLYPVKSGDVVVDLGAGDGKVLRVATERGARGYGVELNPLLVAIARLRVGSGSRISQGNMWQYDLPEDVTLVYAFVVSRDTKKLEKYLQRQANRLHRPIMAMTFGARLPHISAVGSLNAHTLYKVKPLQLKKA